VLAESFINITRFLPIISTVGQVTQPILITDEKVTVLNDIPDDNGVISTF
jgi:hypothetical protein